MPNAAILLHTDVIDTSRPKLMGRHAAGESFLRGFVRHAEVDRFYFWNFGNEPLEKLEALARQIAPTDKPVEWIPERQIGRFAEPGTLYCSGPSNAMQAWNRRLLGASLYSICGVTHTTASERVMDGIVDLLLSPVEPWDTLICTSRAVRTAVETQLAMALDYLGERLGSVQPPAIRLDTVPLGVNTDEFHRSEAQRHDWRERLGIADDAVAVLYVGRFAAHAKMNSVPMAMALEQAAQRTKRSVHWILSGWAANDYMMDAFAGAAQRFAPSVTTHVLDGRLPEVRFPIWSAADVFFSLSDNIQETFGLTPVEAMAAGLPSVVSDWDGYRDLIRHGVDGFRIQTLMARPGTGVDLAFAHANGFDSYDRYVGSAAQFVAVDVATAADALLSLIDDEALRHRMGDAALERARTTFDWAVVVRQYQALWADLAGIRSAAPAKPQGSFNPRRPDPFALFAGYPTQPLHRNARIAAAPSGKESLSAILQDPSVRFALAVLPSRALVEATLDRLAASGPATVGDILEQTPPGQRGRLERGLVWLAKYGLVTVYPLPVIAGD